MECSQSSPKYICSICGSRTMTIKIEEKIEESTTTTIIEEENSNFVPLNNNNNNNSRRVPFPEAGVDIVDRKLKNTEESLEKEIEEYCSHDDDILTYTESWTDNWLFRKKQDENNQTSFKPVSMFVPNTTAKYRAMIGDQNVDEMSDLSDDHCSSNDTEDEEEDDDTKTRRSTVGNGMAKYIYDQRSRVFIDGKSKHHIEELSLRNNNSGEAILSRDSFDTNFETDVKEKNIVSQEYDLTDLNDDVTNENGVENNRSYYRSELFIETRDVNQNSSSSRSSLGPLLLLQTCDDKLSDIDFNLFSPPKPGTIADREHRKWETAAPIENNPYSEENLQRRLIEKKYTPKYSGTTSLLGIASRINGLDAKNSCDNVSTTAMTMKNDIDFETMDMLPEKTSVNNNNTPIIASEDKSIVRSNFQTMDLPEKSNTPIIEESRKDEIINCKSPDIQTRIKQLKSNHIREEDEYGTKNKKKCSNSSTIKVTKKNATATTTTINEVDDYADEEEITLPSVKKLVEVFSQKSREITESLNKTKDKNTTTSVESEQQERPKFKRVERTLQQSSSSPRPLHLHSLTARSLSKEFREGLR